MTLTTSTASRPNTPRNPRPSREHLPARSVVLAGILAEVRVVAMTKPGEKDAKTHTLIVHDGKAYRLSALPTAPAGLALAHHVALRGSTFGCWVAMADEVAGRVTADPLTGPLGMPVALHHEEEGWYALRRAPALDRLVALDGPKTRPIHVSTRYYDQMKAIAEARGITLSAACDLVAAAGLAAMKA